MPHIEAGIRFVLAGAILSLAASASIAQQSDKDVAIPAGSPKSAKTRTLEAGAKALQSPAPLKPFMCTWWDSTL